MSQIYSYTQRLLVMLLLCFTVEVSYAQIVADFDADSTVGCVPFIADFNDLSTGGIVYRHWDFGNGNTAVGNNMNPSAAYNSSGTYTVTLTVSDGVDTVSITKAAYIHVLAAPNAAFTFQPTVTGCAPFPFQVTDLSIPSNAPISSWKWDFDDGTPIVSGQNQTHVYANAGTYSVTLIVTDTLGCSSTSVQPNLVNVHPQPSANFYTTGSATACAPPLTVNFLNSSTGTGTLTYNWTIDGTSYTTPTVTSTFTQPGGYDVELIVTNTLGCTDTLSIPNYVWIGSIQAAMDIPDTTCPGVPTTMTNISNGGSNFYWDFGDGSTDFGPVVDHIYTTPGTYTVTLISSAGLNCDDTVTQDIVVEYVQAAFTSSPNFSCEPFLIANFVDQSIGNIVEWKWYFGTHPGYPRDSSDVQNPSHTYYGEGIFDDTLVVTTANGCKSMAVIPANDTIEITQAYFTPSVSNGCAPLYVDFTNLTTPVASIDSTIWDFADGSPLDYSFSPNHTFMNPGEYQVELTVISVDGCTTNYQVWIEVGSVQTANFTIDTIVACGSDTVNFINLSQDTNLLDEYFWDFGDGTSSSDFEPAHLFLDTGYMSVSLVASYNGCKDTITIDSIIHISGPVIGFDNIINCDTPNLMTFVPHALGGTSFWWDFGDSSTIDSVNWNTSHLYPPVDSNYMAILTVYDSTTGCWQDAEVELAIRFLEGILTNSDTTICKGDVVFFNTGSSINALGDVRWGFNTDTAYSSGFTNNQFTFTQPGLNHVFAVVRDQNDCTDTLVNDIFVYHPVVDFVGNPTSGCDPLPVQFTDLTVTDTNIVSWHWKFGDGSTSSLQHPLHIYDGVLNNTYDVELIVVDTFGCTNEHEKTNYIHTTQPPASFAVVNNLLCDGDSAYFHSAPTGTNFTYFWDFGDGTTSTLYQPQHAYSSGNYTVSLTVTDGMGCDSTYVMPQNIDVQSLPIANFIANPTVATCYPASVMFTDSSIVQNGATWTWNFGDSPNFVTLSGTTAQNLYNNPGQYDVTLVVKTTYGCTDTITKPNFINIGGPVANIAVNPAIGCVGDTVFFDAINNSGARLFTWDFGDGVVDTSSYPQSMIGHMYTQPGNYPIILLYADSSGLCQKSDSIILEVDHVESHFLTSQDDGCVPLSLGVINQSFGEDSWRWFLNGNQVSTNFTTGFHLDSAGMHEIKLVAWDSQTQCSDTSTHIIEVFPLPDVQAIDDKAVCVGDSYQLNANPAGLTYQWGPNTWLDNPNIKNPVTTPTSDIQYVVTATDSNLCQNTDTVEIIVQHKPQILFFPSDTSIFIGGDYQVYMSSNMPLLYSWNPANSASCSDCAEPLVSPTTPTVYTLTYQDTNMCFVSDTSFFVHVEEDFSVYIPNSFTPNWDGDNDLFMPVTYGIKELVYMRIFDRWGVQVYETTDLNQGWDGRVNGRITAHNSVFSYKISVKRFNGMIEDYVGMVVLVSR